MPDMQLSLNYHKLDMKNYKKNLKFEKKFSDSFRRGCQRVNPTDSSNHGPCRL